MILRVTSWWALLAMCAGLAIPCTTRVSRTRFHGLGCDIGRRSNVGALVVHGFSVSLLNSRSQLWSVDVDGKLLRQNGIVFPSKEKMYTEHQDRYFG
eukprot:Trichotokara_eunicae@DN9798_c0_g1_i1.p1